MSSSTIGTEVVDQTSLDSQNPWPGLPAFTEQQHDFFFGREQEAHDLFRCVKRERLTVLFGKSGLGKTSLLQAGLFPLLRDSTFLPVYLRLSYADGAPSFDAQVQMALKAAIEQSNLAEVSFPQPGVSLWEYLHRRGGNLVGQDGSVVTPVLVFDQFEECFTLGSRSEMAVRIAQDILPGIADLVENRMPSSLTKKLAEDRDLAKLYEIEAPGARILITLREDYLPNLEVLRDSMPSLVFSDNRMRLTEMTGRQALSVVAKPNPGMVDPDVAEYIVRFVAGAQTESAEGDAHSHQVALLEGLEIAPAILSLFCRQINEERIRQHKPKITSALVDAQKLTIIDDFYRDCIANMHPAVRRLIEDHLLTRAGYRNNIDLAQARSDLEQAGAAPACIDELVKRRLLQIEQHRGVPRLELTHDVLAEPVMRSRNKWEEERKEREAKEREQQKASEALAQARMAEQEALSRARSLRKVVAAIGFVCLLLTGLLLWGVIKSREANRMQKQAELMQHRAEESARTAQQLGQQAKNNEDRAKASEQQARDNAQNAANSLDQAEKSAKAEEKNHGTLIKVSSDSLDQCVRVSRLFYRPDLKGSNQYMLELYEGLLAGDEQCLGAAKTLHGVVPENFKVTDALVQIPLLAADSASQRGDNAAVKKDCDSAIGFADELRDQQNQRGVAILIARTYVGAASYLVGIDSDSARRDEKHGMDIVEALQRGGASGSFSDRDWNGLSQVYWYDARFLQNMKMKPDAIKVYNISFEDEERAYALNPKENEYASEELKRSLGIWQYGEALGDNAMASKWSDQAVNAARRGGNSQKIQDDFSDKRMELEADGNYGQVFQLLSMRIESLKSSPVSDQAKAATEASQLFSTKAQEEEKQAAASPPADEVSGARQRELAAKPEKDDRLKQWTQAAEYRTYEVKILESVKPGAYPTQQRELADAYGDLSWDEVSMGKVDDGDAHAQKGMKIAERNNDLKDRSRICRNESNSFWANKRYDEAQAIVGKQIEWLSVRPEADRQQELATAYSDASQLAELKKQWIQSVKYRKLEVETRTPLAVDKATKKELAIAYGNLAWSEVEAGQFDDGVHDARTGYAMDPEEHWIQVNEGDGLLLSGHSADARALYLRIKDERYRDRTMSQDIANDLQTLCKMGYARPEMGSIAQDVGIKDDKELSACLASSAK